MGSQSCEDGKSVLATFRIFLGLKTQPVDLEAASQKHGEGSSRAEAETKADAQQPRSVPSGAHATEDQNQTAIKVPHVYINLLKNTRSRMTVRGTAMGKSAFERNKEVARANALHQLETEDHTKIRVISLPADDRVLLKKSFTGSRLGTVNQLIDRAVEGILHNKHDFHFSEQSKKDLFPGYGEKNTENKIKIRTKIAELMMKSAEKLGVNKNQHTVSQSRDNISAIWFDFIKLQLTDHVLNQFDPSTFNITCKDGIDRAHVHSTYYNQHRQLEQGMEQQKMQSSQAGEEGSSSEQDEKVLLSQHHGGDSSSKQDRQDKNLSDKGEPSVMPNNRKFLTQEEFHRLLHTPARLVKGRDMNHHARLLVTVEKTIKNAPNKNPNASWHGPKKMAKAKDAACKRKRTFQSGEVRAKKKLALLKYRTVNAPMSPLLLQ